MFRPKGIAHVALIAICVLLAGLTGYAWATYRADLRLVIYSSPTHNYVAGPRPIGLWLAYVTYKSRPTLRVSPSDPWEFRREPDPPDFDQASRKPGGFHWGEFSDKIGSAWYTLFVVFPYWFLLAIELTIAGWAIRRLCRNRIPAGHCQHCGYDLRATPDRCPECGRPVSPTVPV